MQSLFKINDKPTHLRNILVGTKFSINVDTHFFYLGQLCTNNKYYVYLLL